MQAADSRSARICTSCSAYLVKSALPGANGSKAISASSARLSACCALSTASWASRNFRASRAGRSLPAEALRIVAAHAATRGLAQTNLGLIVELPVEELLPLQTSDVLMVQSGKIMFDQARECGAVRQTHVFTGDWRPHRRWPLPSQSTPSPRSRPADARAAAPEDR